jgi:hypothetical protein
MQIKRAIAGLLGCVLLSGCFGQNTKVAATFDNGEVPAGVYIYHQIIAVNEAYQALGDYSVTAAEVLKRDVNGENGSSFVQRRALEMTKNFALVEFACMRQGVELGADVEEQIAGIAAKQWETDGSLMQLNGISQSSFQKIGLNAQKSLMLFDKWYGPGGEREVAQEEMKSYYLENYRRVLLMVVPKYDNDGAALEGDRLKEREDLIEAYADRIENGEKLYGLAVEFDRQLHSLSGSADLYEKPSEEQLEAVIERGSSLYPEGLTEKIFSDSNTTERFDAAAYTVFFEQRDLMGDGVHFQASDMQIRRLLRDEEFDKALEDYDNISGYSTNAAAIKRFRPENLKI